MSIRVALLEGDEDWSEMCQFRLRDNGYDVEVFSRSHLASCELGSDYLALIVDDSGISEHCPLERFEMALSGSSRGSTSILLITTFFGRGLARRITDQDRGKNGNYSCIDRSDFRLLLSKLSNLRRRVDVEARH